MMRSGLIFFFLFTLFFSCDYKHKEKSTGNENSSDRSARENPLAGTALNSNAVIIGLLYHRFDEEEYPSTSISGSLFEDHLQYIIDSDIEVIRMGEVVNKLSDPSGTSRYVTITIDDAFRSFYESGFPLLKEYGLKATLFMNTETVGSGDYLNWEEIRELANYGIEIGNHSHSHEYFLNLPDSTRRFLFEQDVKKAQQEIEYHTGTKPVVFAYPYGEYDTLMQEVIRKMKFYSACAQNSGVISKYSDRFALPRFPMTDFYGQMEGFKEKISMDPLPVKQSIPHTTRVTENPPGLILYLDDNDLDLERVQCFIQGSDCDLSIKFNPSPVIEIKALKPLTDRRHLYTITVPSESSGRWHWYSHQWVFPGRK